MRVRTRSVVAALALGTAVSLAACGDGGVSLPSGTATITGPNGTATVSIPGRDSPTGEPTTAPPTTATPTATRTTATPTTATPTTPTTATPTETVTTTTTAEPTTAEPTTAEPTDSPTGEAAGPTGDAEEGISPWWWVLGGVLLLAAIIWFVLARSARRRRQEAELVAGIEQRGEWAVDHGVGQLIGAADPGATQQAWSRLNATLVDLSSEVGVLARETPADRGAAVIGLRDAVASLQGAAESHARARLTGDPSPGTAAALFDARDRLARALAPFRPPAG